MGGAFVSLSIILCVVLFGSLVPQGLPAGKRIWNAMARRSGRRVPDPRTR